ncbi:hypothetical protein M1N82_00780 [Dehalococcoidia bacterium]|nr:hypothetical protein [Dehalococcoidia bacterium]
MDENAEASELFRHLGEMERQHVQIFRDMPGEAGKYQPSESDGMVANADSDIEALQLAIGAEKDAILFYYLMRDIMPPRTHPVVNKIIAEEKLHLRQLSEAKKRLAAL